MSPWITCEYVWERTGEGGGGWRVRVEGRGGEGDEGVSDSVQSKYPVSVCLHLLEVST